VAVPEPREELPFDCVNCGAELAELVRPYLFCSPLCQEEAHTVRYARRVVRDSRIKDPLVKEAVDIRIAFVLGGGYARAERELSAAQRQAIFERDAWKCRICGTAEATQIDHIAGPTNGDINHPDNLQAVCDPCHRAKTRESFVSITSAEQQQKAEEIRFRIRAPEPFRVSDDEIHWPTAWRALASNRKNAVQV
jgi:5-methylcytosine-specific restriction endonuclease McrA